MHRNIDLTELTDWKGHLFVKKSVHICALIAMETMEDSESPLSIPRQLHAVSLHKQLDPHRGKVVIKDHSPTQTCQHIWHINASSSKSECFLQAPFLLNLFWSMNHSRHSTFMSWMIEAFDPENTRATEAAALVSWYLSSCHASI